MDRFLLNVANAVALMGGMLAFIVLFFSVARSLGGEPAIGDLALAGALVVVPYCFAGTLHRIVALGSKSND